VLAAIAGEKRPVVLVGHSFGGMTISNVAESAPAKIKTLVYVAAYLPANGQSLLALSQTDHESKMGPAFRVSDDKTEARRAVLQRMRRGDPGRRWPPASSASRWLRSQRR
jgi:pimeloyl-ACP methyl ester carboxylesterase